MKIKSFLYLIVNASKKIKKIITPEKSFHYIYECLNCGEKFDGKRVEYFIKHQINSKHFDYTKSKKQLK